jgi:hypothetical protein
MKKVLIKKLDGSVEPFDEKKLTISLERSGATKKVIDSIIKHTTAELVEGMTTSEIYKNAFTLLRKQGESPVAARYSLKRAVMDLGPSGFPFENLIGGILEKKGYKISLGLAIEGACAFHEVDVVAEKKDRLVVVEAKFHNQLGVKSDLKVALYVKARYDDIEKLGFGKRLKTGQKHESWIITNTNFTKNANRYGKCVGMKMIGWSHPRDGGLQALIEETALHPLTCLTTLSQNEKTKILNSGTVLCKDVKADNNILKKAGLSGIKLKEVIKEINTLCVPRKA